MNGQPQPFHSSQSGLPPPRGRGHKRSHKEAFGHRERKQGPSGHQTALAVPNFGGPLPLPIKPPATENKGKRSKKDKRRNNKLGLTPKAEDPDSADETEDDENEETKLAADGLIESGQSQLLHINYKGRTSTLQSAADIAAWIEVRKKRYPTKARAIQMAEWKHQHEEARKAKQEAEKENLRAKAIAKAEEKQAQLDDYEKTRKKDKKERSSKEGKEGSEDPAAKAKRKIEDLRRRLEKEERRIARAEAKVSGDSKKVRDGSQERTTDQATKNNKRKRSSGPHSTDHPPSRPSLNGAEAVAPDNPLSIPDANPHTNTAPDLLTPTSQPPSPTPALAPSHDPNVASTKPSSHPHPPPNLPDPLGGTSPTLSSSLSSTLTSSETSSSGSSFTNSDSDSNSDDTAPSETTIKRNGPERVPPPPRTQTVRCKFFAQKGTCRKGKNCRFKHERPDRGVKKGMPAGGGHGRKEGRAGRVGLYQRLVEQEKRSEEAAKRAAEEQGREQGFVEQAGDGKFGLVVTALE